MLFRSSRGSTELYKKTRYDKLQLILHRRINEKQSYPSTAIVLNQTGKVTLRFLLHINGMITDTAIIKSSGVSSLDHAALASVEKSMPIKESSTYLSHATYFQVEVIFM